MSNLDQLATSFAAMKKEISEQFQSEVQLAFKELFDKHPEVKSMQWAQYTPYFNDGEPCEFYMC